MASGIDPDPAIAPGARPATKPPSARSTPAPAASAAAPVVVGNGTRGPRQAAVAVNDDGPSVAANVLKLMPAWAISMLVHIVALLSMAVMVTPPPEKEKIRVITSTAPEVEENFEEFEEEEPAIDPGTPDVPDMAVPTDVAVVDDVQIVNTAEEVDAAPLAVEFTDFGTETAPAADMMSSIGAVGGVAGGFGGRANAMNLAVREGGGGDTESAVDRALKWMLEHQLDDGGWSFDLTTCPRCQGRCSHSGDDTHGPDRAAATAMALLPFLGRGYTHREGPYKKQIEMGVAFLAAKSVAGRGKIYDKSGSMYSQGLAGIALSESYGMTQDNRLAMPAQLALNFIMAAQDPRGGGWRYHPGQAGDTSAVGWQLMALKSGNMSYLQVDPLTFKKASDFLDFVQADGGATYGYADNSSPTAVRSAVGLLCRMYLGWKKDNPALRDGVARLAKAGPSKDLYQSYYATQVMHHVEGDVWIAWNNKMKSMLLSTQSKKDHEAGSWHEGVDGGYGARVAGRLYCTSLATMILEVYYRHLPIYRNQSVEEEFQE